MKRAQLDECAKCDEPSCTNKHAFEVTQKCHPSSALLVAYNPETGVLLVACAACEEPVVAIEVVS